MDRLDSLDRENIAGRLAREFVRAVRRADRDCQCVDFRFLDEIGFACSGSVSSIE